MSQLTDKYGEVFGAAQQLGGTNLNATEENGHMTISGTLPTKYDLYQVWNKVKEIDPALNAGDLTLNLTTARDDIFGEYEVKPGDNLSEIAKSLTSGALNHQQIFDANSHQLDDPNAISVGQRLIIPNF